MRRRDFIRLVGGAALPWPLAAHAQDGMPVIGFMHTASLDRFAFLVAAFRKGLAEEGYVEGRNVAMEYRWAEGHYDRLPKLASELVARHVNVLAATGGDESGLAAKAATTTIPVVFQIGGNPIQLGLVASFNRPGGNLTGTTLLSIETAPKRLQLLHEIVPDATNVAVLVNPTDPGAETQSAQLKSAARTVGMQIKFFQAATDADIDSAFAAMAAQSAKALVVQADPFFTSRRDRLVDLATRTEPQNAGQRLTEVDNVKHQVLQGHCRGVRMAVLKGLVRLPEVTRLLLWAAPRPMCGLQLQSSADGIHLTGSLRKSTTGLWRSLD